jgi:hypothetical protein
VCHRLLRRLTLSPTNLPSLRAFSTSIAPPSDTTVDPTDKFFDAYQQSMETGFDDSEDAVQVKRMQVQPAPAPPATPIVDALGRAYATGKRKESIARVWVYPGTGKFTINNRSLVDHVVRPSRRFDVLKPLVVTEQVGKMDVRATVQGGGDTGTSF